VIDTGVDFQHPDLNVVDGVNCSGSPSLLPSAKGGDDDHYHGTHVAGTIAALDNGIGVVGVAPGARIWAVKVLNKRGSGYSSWIIAGIDWVAANAVRSKWPI
jgi:subtilisin